MFSERRFDQERLEKTTLALERQEIKILSAEVFFNILKYTVVIFMFL